MDWKSRQMNDPYVKARNNKQLLSRAYFKLEEMDEKFHIFSKSSIVVELGAAPGGWTQYLIPRVKHIYAYDILPINVKADNLTFVRESVFNLESVEKCHILLSDMAPNLSGNNSVDKYAMEGIIDQLFILGKKTKPGFVWKIFQTNINYITDNKNLFKWLKFCKPNASRKESNEIYAIGQWR